MASRGRILIIAATGGVALAALFALRDPFLPWVSESRATLGESTSTADTLGESVRVVELSERLQRVERENETLREQLDRLDELGQELEQSLEEFRSRPRVRPLQDYPIPEQLEFCGETVSLADPVMRQRFEAEFHRFLVNRHWTLRWMRRSRDVFPEIEKRLAAAGMPDDLKYVSVIESSLDPRATSSAGAVGYWQFTRDTGRRYGLHRTSNVDERRDLAAATEAALKYMGELHEEFGSWALVMAAYNAGENRIRDAIEYQGHSDYHRLYLPRETEAYWYKAATVKLLMENPELYDLELPDDGWQATVCDTLLIEFSRETPIVDLLADCGLDYRGFKELNPGYRRPLLPQGRHRLAIPRDNVGSITDRYPDAELRLNVAPATAP